MEIQRSDTVINSRIKQQPESLTYEELKEKARYIVLGERKVIHLESQLRYSRLESIS